MNERPYVMVNIAMTADGKTDTIARSGAAISSPQDMERVDRLRAESDGIMVGGHTLLGDDPRLTVKSERLRRERVKRGLEANPVKAGVVTRANLRPDSRFLTAGLGRVMVFTTTQTDAAQIDLLRQQGMQVFVIGEQRVDLSAALTELKQAGIQRLLVEGGGRLNEELLRLGLVDEISIYVAPLIFGGAQAPTFASGPGLKREAAIRLQLVEVENLGDGGIVLHYLPETD